MVQRAASVVESTVNRLFLQIDGTLASLPALVGPLSRNHEVDADEVSRVLRGINFQNLNFRDLLLVRPDGVAWASAQAIVARPAIAHRPGGNRPGDAVGRRQHRRPGAEPDDGGMGAVLRAPGEAAGLGMLYAAAEVPIPLIVTLLNPAAEVPGLRVAVDADGWQAAGRPAA